MNVHKQKVREEIFKFSLQNPSSNQQLIVYQLHTLHSSFTNQYIVPLTNMMDNSNFSIFFAF
jgi:hypothetical protein